MPFLRSRILELRAQQLAPWELYLSEQTELCGLSVRPTLIGQICDLIVTVKVLALKGPSGTAGPSPFPVPAALGDTAPWGFCPMRSSECLVNKF